MAPSLLDNPVSERDFSPILVALAGLYVDAGYARSR
jgi:hypothetical protein